MAVSAGDAWAVDCYEMAESYLQSYSQLMSSSMGISLADDTSDLSLIQSLCDPISHYSVLNIQWSFESKLWELDLESIDL